MILPDASIWIDHFRRGVATVGELASRVDVQLRASARLTSDGRLWSRDSRLAAAAGRLGIAAGEPA